jgi:tetratricopeptide (TPR) repeat protein
VKARIQQLLSAVREFRLTSAQTAAAASIATIVASAVFLLTREALFELIGNVASTAVTRGPVWRKVLVGGLLIFGLATMVASVGGRRGRRVDDASRVVTGQPDALPPSTLPPVTHAVIGRLGDIDRVLALIDSERAIAVVGRRGAGTSTLAGHVANQIAERFPDGQIYLDLRGVAPGRPLTERRALRRVLNALGFPEPQSDRNGALDVAADALQSWLSNRRALFLLDNVDHPHQVRRLLPGGSGCRFLLAGSVDLEKLSGVHIYDLPELGEDAAVELLSTVGDAELVSHDRQSAVELVNRCGRQPLAIRLLGQLLRDRTWPPSRILDAMESGLLTARSTQESEQSAALRPVWAACDVTYRDLSLAHRRLFRLLLLVPTSEIGITAVAAVAGVPSTRAAGLLGDLARRGLVESTRPGHYRIRQMLALSGRFYLEQEDLPKHVARARLRLARHYAQLATQHAEPMLPGARRAGPDRLSAIATARAWFQQEHDLLFNLVTSPPLVVPARARRGANKHPVAVERWLWRLAVALCTWYAIEGRLGDWNDVCEAVLALPWARTNPATASWAHNELGVIRRLRGEPLTAWKEFQLAAQKCRNSRNLGLGQILTNLGMALADQGQLEWALRNLELGLELRARSDRYGQAISVLALGVTYLSAGELDAARRRLAQAANAFDALGDLRGLAAALNAIGVVLWMQDDRLGATEHWQLARRQYVELGDQVGLAGVLVNIAAGTITTHPDRAAYARDLLVESQRLRAGQPETRATGLSHLYLGDAFALCHEPAEAQRHWQEAARILGDTDRGYAAEWQLRSAGAMSARRLSSMIHHIECERPIL